MDRITFATSSGVTWFVLAVHFGGGLTALLAGATALTVAKGGRVHKQSGVVFTWAMIVLGVTAALIAAIEGKTGSVIGGTLTVYLVFTAMTTVKQFPGSGRKLDVALMILAFGLGAVMFVGAIEVWQLPGHARNGVPAGMMFFLATIVLLAALGDARMIRNGALRGSRRLARHLWRMCFGLFIASGSFFLGQMKFLPRPVRSLPLMMALGVAPLVILLYWMWRVRVRGRLTGLILPQEARPSVKVA